MGGRNRKTFYTGNEGCFYGRREPSYNLTAVLQVQQKDRLVQTFAMVSCCSGFYPGFQGLARFSSVFWFVPLPGHEDFYLLYFLLTLSPALSFTMTTDRLFLASGAVNGYWIVSGTLSEQTITALFIYTVNCKEQQEINCQLWYRRHFDKSLGRCWTNLKIQGRKIWKEITETRAGGLPWNWSLLGWLTLPCKTKLYFGLPFDLLYQS